MLISLWIRDKFFGGCFDILDIGSWGFFWGRLQLLVHIIRKLLCYWWDDGKGISYLSFGGFRALWQNNESFHVSYQYKIRNISQTLRTCWLLTNNPLNKSYTRWQLRGPSNSFIFFCCWGFDKFEKKMHNHNIGSEKIISCAHCRRLWSRYGSFRVENHQQSCARGRGEIRPIYRQK